MLLIKMLQNTTRQGLNRKPLLFWHTWKNTLSGIELATFQFQCKYLNHYTMGIHIEQLTINDPIKIFSLFHNSVHVYNVCAYKLRAY